MKSKASESSEGKAATSFLAILGLVTEMARRVNENIAKVQLQPLRVGMTERVERVITDHAKGLKV